LNSAVAQLLFVLGAIYLFDCVRWVARNAVVFRWFPILGTSLTNHLQVANQLKRAAVFGFPLPPFGSIFTTEEWPFVAGANGLTFVPPGRPLFSQPTSEDVRLEYTELSRLRLDEKTLVLEGNGLHTFGSKRAAQGCIEILRRLVDSPSPASWVEQKLQDRFDIAQLKSRLQLYSRYRRVVFIANAALFMALFGGLYWLLMMHVSSLLPLGLMLLGTWIVAALATMLAVRRVLPKEVRPSPFQLIITLVSPMALVRSSDLIEPELIPDFHPCAVAAVMLSPLAARTEIERFQRAARFQTHISGAAPAAKTSLDDDVSFRVQLVKHLDALLKDLPGPSSGEAKGWHCPRCLTEYSREKVENSRECASCPGVSLANAAK
jgi:hypothetical protein